MRASAAAVMAIAPFFARLPVNADSRKPMNGRSTVARAIRIGYVNVGGVKRKALIFQLVDIFGVNAFIMFVYVEDNGQRYGYPCGCQYDGKDGECLSAVFFTIVAPEGDEVEDGGIDHQLDAHQHHNRIAAGHN